MNFTAIRTQILGNVGKTGATASNTLALAGAAINLAIDEIKWNTIIEALLEDLTTIPLVANTATYSMDSDVEILTRVAIQTSATEGEIERVYAANLLKKINTTLDTGAPNFYRQFGTDGSGNPQMKVYPTFIGEPAGGKITGEYMPIMPDLDDTTTTSNEITRKYFNSVIKIATEILYRSVVDHKSQPLANQATLETLVQREVGKIMKREYGDADHNTRTAVDRQIRKVRGQRYTQ